MNSIPKKALLLVLVLADLFCYSQNIDSLKGLLKTAKHDIVKCNLLNNLVELESDDAIWPKYNEQLKSICESNIAKLPKSHPDLIIFQKYYANALGNVGYLAIQQNNPIVGIEYSKKSLAIQEEIGDKEGLATSLNNLGIMYMNQGQIVKALECYKRSLKIREGFDNKSLLANAINNVGRLYHLQGDYSKSLEYYQRSYSLQKEIKSEAGIANSLNNIGLVYHDLKNFSKAVFGNIFHETYNKRISKNKTNMVGQQTGFILI